MLTSSDQTVAISSLGWVDRGNLWIYRAETHAVESATMVGATHLSLHPGADDHVTIVHHFENGRVELTVHRFPEIATVLSRIVVNAGKAEVTGSTQPWLKVPRHYTAYVQTAQRSDFGLIRITPEENAVELQELSWFNDEYDKGYQGIVGVAEIPGTDLLLVSVQRSSQLVIYDPVSRTSKGRVELAGRAGNPQMYFRRTAPELWAGDYDTILRLNTANWRVVNSRSLRGALTGTQQFIGSFSADPSEELCVVPRPFSGDVLAIDMRNFKARYRCRTGGQPLEAAVLQNHRVLARDWKSGSILDGQLQKRWLAV